SCEYRDQHPGQSLLHLPETTGITKTPLDRGVIFFCLKKPFAVRRACALSGNPVQAHDDNCHTCEPCVKCPEQLQNYRQQIRTGVKEYDADQNDPKCQCC